MSDRGHSVQFYESPAFLMDRVAAFMAGGLEAGEAAIVIATPEHRASLEAELTKRGIDVPAARTAGTFLDLDACETLDMFMVDGMPDRERFINAVGRAIADARPHARYPIVRAFGEMVAILWANGHPDAAIALEEHWNELLGHHPFSLLCGYPMDILAKSSIEDVARIVSTHDLVERGEGATSN